MRVSRQGRCIDANLEVIGGQAEACPTEVKEKADPSTAPRALASREKQNARAATLGMTAWRMVRGIAAGDFSALGERLGCDYAGAFFDGDDLVGGNISDGLVALTAWPADDERVDSVVSAEAKGEDQLAGRQITSAAGEHFCLS